MSICRVTGAEVTPRSLGMRQDKKQGKQKAQHVRSTDLHEKTSAYLRWMNKSVPMAGVVRCFDYVFKCGSVHILSFIPGYDPFCMQMW
ncbi:hypothetical protein MGYG_06958 [Nannizzia gypsea CBS 118893]|uniref:Uncharacterized protein n=1 Tax=Arthroderma gypseum (strain ATCC MYA-4604 / CBS 118893) TaxID=535722 RepID=E4V1P3_ARTGP|nr:hypothetical protein MGYG_06958 [Nannizzia gypsea CBS 118893]EFR03958.1 hypothetical protein MGYG_06958 [Nannizzia gypsea CBS 118893]